MKTLIAEDDFTSRLLLQEMLKGLGQVHIAVNGREAVQAVQAALGEGQPYDLVCLDIMMPEMDGYAALKEIRSSEETAGYMHPNGSKIVMTTALSGVKNVMTAFAGLCDAYLVKPIEKEKLMEQLRTLGLTVA